MEEAINRAEAQQQPATQPKIANGSQIEEQIQEQKDQITQIPGLETLDEHSIKTPQLAQKYPDIIRDDNERKNEET